MLSESGTVIERDHVQNFRWWERHLRDQIEVGCRSNHDGRRKWVDLLPPRTLVAAWVKASDPIGEKPGQERLSRFRGRTIPVNHGRPVERDLKRHSLAFVRGSSSTAKLQISCASPCKHYYVYLSLFFNACLYADGYRLAFMPSYLPYSQQNSHTHSRTQ